MLLVSIIVLAIAGVFAGCAKKSSGGNQAFAKATPEIKAIWDQAEVADKANDYVTAITNYRILMAQREKLTPQQSEALDAASLAIKQRLSAAANSGDAVAKEASMKLVGAQYQH